MAGVCVAGGSAGPARTFVGGTVVVRAAILVGYLAAVVAIGAAGRRMRRPGAEDFFLAGRMLGPWILLATMVATNFSGFTVVGFSGAGYRLGFAFYPVMAFGTGFMALSFLVIGRPVRLIGKKLGLITPPELVAARFGARPLTVAFALAMTVFTLPYLAIQPMAAGYALQSLLGIPYQLGAGLLTGLVLVYVLLGGMRSVVWTDVLQALMMLVLLVGGFLVVAAASGGAGEAYTRLAQSSPEHFMRPGAGAGLPLGLWASYMLLWLLADPMFPQLFQRFYAARSERSLMLTMVCYPIVTTALFFFPVAIGVLGRLHFPALEGQASDGILPLLMERFGGDWLSALASAGLIAAIMSTMDSQLLTLGSIVQRDILGGRKGRVGDGRSGRRAPDNMVVTRLCLVFLALAGFALALKPPATILAIATETFAGLAVLIPTVVASLYWPRATAAGSLVSIVSGELLVVLYHFDLLPTFGLLPAIPATGLATLVIVVSGFANRRGEGSLPRGWPEVPGLGLSRRAKAILSAVFVTLLVLSVDFWRFGRAPRLFLGLPSWLGYFVVLGLALSLAFALLARSSGLLRIRSTDHSRSS